MLLRSDRLVIHQRHGIGILLDFTWQIVILASPVFSPYLPVVPVKLGVSSFTTY